MTRIRRVGFLAVLALVGCDVNRAQRAAEREAMEAAVASAQQVRAEVEAIDRAVGQAEAEVQRCREEQKSSDDGYEKNKQALAEYVLDHKLATLAAVSAAGGGVALLSDLDDDQKAAIAGPTALAFGYCLMNGDECTDVSARIAWYGSQAALYRTQASDAQGREQAERSRMAEMEQQRRVLRNRLGEQEAAVENLRARVKALECSLPICI